jgi:hypothetical protein
LIGLGEADGQPLDHKAWTKPLRDMFQKHSDDAEQNFLPNYLFYVPSLMGHAIEVWTEHCLSQQPEQKEYYRTSDIGDRLHEVLVQQLQVDS